MSTDKNEESNIDDLNGSTSAANQSNNRPKNEQKNASKQFSNSRPTKKPNEFARQFVQQRHNNWNNRQSSNSVKNNHHSINNSQNSQNHNCYQPSSSQSSSTTKQTINLPISIPLETVLSSTSPGSVFLTIRNGQLVLSNFTGPLHQESSGNQLVFGNSGGSVSFSIFPEVDSNNNVHPSDNPSRAPRQSDQKFGRYSKTPASFRQPKTSNSSSLQSKPSTSSSSQPKPSISKPHVDGRRRSSTKIEETDSQNSSSNLQANSTSVKRLINASGASKQPQHIKNVPGTSKQPNHINNVPGTSKQPQHINNVPARPSKQPKSFDCPLCLKTMFESYKVTLRDCQHSICRYCLMRRIENTTQAPVICPYVEGSDNCLCFIPESQIRKVATENVWGYYLQIRGNVPDDDVDEVDEEFQESEDKVNDTFHCHAANCDGGGMLEEANSREFTCSSCGAVNCVVCRAIHTGIGCEQYWQELDFINGNNVASNSNLYPDISTLSLCDTPGPIQSNGGRQNNNEYSQLLKLQDENCLTNLEEFECTICYTDVEIGEGVQLHECNHMFCRTCLQRTIEHSDEPEVRCPFVNDNDEVCEFFLQDREVRDIATAEIYDNHCRKSISVVETGSKSFHCKKADCRGWCFIDDVNNPAVYICEVCFSENCLRCQMIHTEMSCQEHREKEARDEAKVHEREETKRYLEGLVNGGQAMRCPNCTVIVEKIDGCDGMKCTMCKIDLCWATKGARWGPKGKGDITGGCRCGVNGQRCSPICKFCH